MKNLYLSIATIFVFASTLTLCVPIHDEDELIVTIKKLHEEFRYFDDIKEYINVHCDELKNKEIIKSLIKNQKSRIVEKSDIRPSLIGWSSLAIAELLTLETMMNFEQTWETKSKKMAVVLGLFLLFQYTFWVYDIPHLAKIFKLEALHESF